MNTVDAFYEAAIIPERWKTALDQASRAWASDGVTVASYPDCLGGLICSQGVEELGARYISEEWFMRDVRAERGVPLFHERGKPILTDQDLFSAEELEHLPFYSDFLGRSGFRWFAGSVLGESGGATVTLSVDRRTERGPFTKDDIARIQHDLPHVRRAAHLSVRSRLAYAEGIIDSMERFDCGAVLIDRLGRVIRLNSKAETYLRHDLQIVSSRLRSPDRASNKSLQELIEANIVPVIGGIPPPLTPVLLHRPGDLPLVVSSFPLARQASDVFQGARSLLLINDPSEYRPIARDVLQEMFRLTPAELRVAAALLRGLDTQQIGAEHQVGAHTIRYHLKSIFAKTGTSHQAQLVSLLARVTERPNRVGD